MARRSVELVYKSAGWGEPLSPGLVGFRPRRPARPVPPLTAGPAAAAVAAEAVAAAAAAAEWAPAARVLHATATTA
eukprot:1352393-Prymnesium_polylepis.1